MKKILLLVLMLCGLVFCYGQSLTIKQGMKISRTSLFRKSSYKIIAPTDTSKGVIIVEGNNIVVDFNGAELRGDASTKRPDEFAGIAIYIRNSKNVTIRNLKARGYKIALLARNTEKLTIENCDFSYNYRPHLNSTQEKEDISDWMSYHHNEKDEWMRYGAAMYLRDCDQLTVRNCRVTGGQNALMLTGCDKGKIYNNDFSFNSGIGIGMYRCNANEVAYNRINFNVRGYSHGVYNRGQDSAGILVYEQSNFNIFYKNSATHSGDGFFLWAGQTTMDTGEGGCNSNEILDNDFSYAPTNGVEVTFSRVRVSGNRIFECDHGIWGGYSYNSKFVDNHFRNNRIGIAIEHGQYNEITDNIFVGDREAIKLWSRKQQPSDWGYAKFRDTRSVGYTIATNSFNSNPIVYNITATDSLSIFSNRYADPGAIFKIDSSVTNLDSLEVDMVDTTMVLPQVKNPLDPFKGNGKLAGRKNIMITEWGPYDFQYPVIWNTNPTDKSDTMKFDLIGPAGEWQLKSVRGVKDLSQQKGKFPATITGIKIPGERTDIMVELVYKGTTITTAFGEKLSTENGYKFYFRKFFQPIDWDVKWFSLDTIFRPHNIDGLDYVTKWDSTGRGFPLRVDKPKKLDYAWWGGILTDTNFYYVDTKRGRLRRLSVERHTQFYTLAEGQADFLPGKYEIGVTWDDAVKLYVDDKLVIDEWNPSKYSFDESPHKKIILNLGGKHSFRVEHLELGGFATLSLKIKPVE